MSGLARARRLLARPGRWSRRHGRLVTVDVGTTPADVPPDAARPWVVLSAEVGGGAVGQVLARAPEGLTGARQIEMIGAELGGAVAHRALRLALRRELAGEAPLGPIPPVSVIVCTRDRPDDLAACLDALARLDPAPLEIIVVDNAPSTDETERVCADRPGVVRIVEPVPGLSGARNRGIAAARGAWVAFTDDDCVPEPAWLAPLAAAARDPLVSALCGHAVPLEVEAPAQYLFEAHGGFERHGDRFVFDPWKLAPHAIAATAGAGANMLLRRAPLLAIGGFHAGTGPGSPVPLSDEKEVFLRLALAGHRIVHDPACRVRHRHRREPAALRSTLRSYGRSEVAFALYAVLRHGAWGMRGVPGWWLGHCLRELAGSVRDRPGSLPARLPLAELRGMLEGPGAALRALGTPPAPLPPAAAEAPPARIVVGAEAPPLTVALATYQRRDSAVRTLRDLAAQTLPAERFEVVAVVDGSTDGTAAALRELELPYALRVHEQDNRGLAAARNQGAALATHPVVAFLDDDIRPDEGWAAAHAAAHAHAHERVVLGIYPPRLPGPGSAWWLQLVAAWWADHFRRKLEPGHRWTFHDVIDGNLSVPVRLFDAVGRLDERFRGGRRQDHELGIRLLERGVELVAEPRAFGWHDFDARMETMLRNVAEEARYDVLIARLHPAAARGLALAALTPAVLAGARPPRPALARARLASLERLGRRGAWAALAGALHAAGYAAGVRQALGPDPGALRELLAGAPEPDPVTVTVPGVGTFSDRLPPGSQWDTDETVARMMAADPGALKLPQALRGRPFVR